MTWLERIFARWRWGYIGRAAGVSQAVEKDGTPRPGGRYICYWNLYERGDGKRRYQQIGTSAGSPHSNAREAEVKAWAKGGPLPTLEEDDYVEAPPPPKKKADLIIFPGGKGGDI